MRPNTKLTTAELKRFFTPWRYAPKAMIWDGRYVSIQPVPAAAAADAPLPVPIDFRALEPVASRLAGHRRRRPARAPESASSQTPSADPVGAVVASQTATSQRVARRGAAVDSRPVDARAFAGIEVALLIVGVARGRPWRSRTVRRRRRGGHRTRAARSPS